MEVFKNQDGSLKKVRSRFSRSREVTLTRWNDDIYLHLNDISKCFASGKFDKTKSKNISMKWEEIEVLRDTFNALVPHVQQMRAEMQGNEQVEQVQVPVPEFEPVPIQQPLQLPLHQAPPTAQHFTTPSRPIPIRQPAAPRRPRLIRQQSQAPEPGAAAAMGVSDFDAVLEENECNDDHNNQLSFLKCRICNKYSYQDWEDY